MELFTTKKIIDNSIKEKSTNEISSKQKINYANKYFNCKKNLLSNKFLVKKVGRFNVHKYQFNKNQNQVKFQKEGRWSLEEHIIFLQTLEKYGTNWKKISKIIPTRSDKQIRSHAQKFYQKLKEYKDTELGIDFTSENISDFNDMIEHIKSVNINYNIVTTFLYLSEKVNLIQKSKKNDKININININNILCEDITKNITNNFNGNGFIDEEISNNNFTNTYTNNIFLKNINNYDNFNNINNFVSLNQVDLHNDTNSNFLKSRLLQNIPCNNIIVYNNYYFNNTSVNLSDKYITLDKLTNKIIFSNLEDNKDNY